MDPAALADLTSRLRAGARAGAGAAPGARATRRAAGRYFTPAPLAEHVCREVLAPLLAAARWQAGVPALRVLDPAAGDGAFLAAALEVIAGAAAARGARVDAAWRRRCAARCLVGVERDAETAAAARARLPGAELAVAEALLEPPSSARGVDAVVGNPPYVRSIRLRQADPALWTALRGRFAATSHGEWDLYAAFVERALDWLRPGGRAGLVVPSRWLTAAFAGPLRAALAARGAVCGVIDFGAEQVFADATTYASVVYLHAAGPAAAPAGAIAAARLGPGGWATGQVATARLGAAPWVLDVGDAAAACAALAARGVALGEVARIAKGVGTNADGAYVLERCAARGALVRGVATLDGEEVEVEVERAATRPCLRGRDVAAWGVVDEAAPHPRAIYPYDAAGALIALPALARRWPRAAAHLRRGRARLEAREDGRFAGAAFHRYGRPQNLAFHADRAAKVVVPDVARAGRALIDQAGALVLDSAYAVRARAGAAAVPDGDPWLHALVLSSPVVALWLRVAGVPLRGGYVRLKTAYLAPLPLPPAGRARDEAVRAARAGDRDEALAALRGAYDLPAALWEGGA